MNHSLSLCSLLLISSGFYFGGCCCKEETIEVPSARNYDEIGRDHIAEQYGLLSDEEIGATDATGHILDASDVVIYQTNSNHYGKLAILSIEDTSNFMLTIKAVTYDDDGTIFSQATDLVVRGTWFADLDAMTETHHTNTEKDFHWSRVTSTDTNILPWGEALFARYKF